MKALVRVSESTDGGPAPLILIHLMKNKIGQTVEMSRFTDKTGLTKRMRIRSGENGHPGSEYRTESQDRSGNIVTRM